MKSISDVVIVPNKVMMTEYIQNYACHGTAIYKIMNDSDDISNKPKVGTNFGALVPNSSKNH